MSIEDQVEDIVRKKKSGSILFSEDFQGLQNPGAVKVALHRMVNRGDIKRIARGIFAKLKYSDLVGEVLPTTEEIAKAIAKRDKARILPTGSYAMHMLGLTTQIPCLLYTSPSPRDATLSRMPSSA